MSRQIIVTLAFILWTPPQVGRSQMLANPALVTPNTRTAIGVTYVNSEVEYDDLSSDIERQILGVDAGFSIDRHMDWFGQIGLITNSEFENSTVDGKGYMFGGGVRYLALQSAKNRLYFYGLFNHTRETFDGDIDAQITDIHFGSAYMFLITSRFRPYAGLELIPVSMGEIEVGGRDTDLERDGILNFRMGANISIKTMVFRIEIAIMNEQTLSLGLVTLI